MEIFMGGSDDGGRMTEDGLEEKLRCDKRYGFPSSVVRHLSSVKKKTGPLRARFSSSTWGRRRFTFQRGTSADNTKRQSGRMRRPLACSNICSMRVAVQAHNAGGDMPAMRSSQGA